MFDVTLNGSKAVQSRLLASAEPSRQRRMTHVQRRHRIPALLALCLGIASLTACESQRTPEQVHAELLRKLPATLHDRQGWARDIQAAFAAQDLEPSTGNLCAVLAVVEQESTYRADPPVPGLGGIAIAEIKRRAAAKHIPEFAIDAALKLRAADGRTYAERLQALRSEREMSELFEEMVARLPLGTGRLLAGLNPVRTGGPMQVRVDFAEQHMRGYPYTVDGSIRHEVFSRRGGLYFGIKHLLGYPADYDKPLYRFADFNAGWHASRNAAFQQAVAIASGKKLVRDGDLLTPGASMGRPGATEAALRGIDMLLGMDAAAIRADLKRGNTAGFSETALYRAVFAIADRKGSGKPVPRARVPDIALESPKITRKLTTEWFAGRVESRWKACMAR